MSEPLTLQRLQVLADRHGRILQTLPMRLGRRQHQCRREIEEVEDELLGMLRLNPEWSQGIGGEIAQVHRYAHICLAANCRCQNVPVIWIRQLQTGD